MEQDINDVFIDYLNNWIKLNCKDIDQQEIANRFQISPQHLSNILSKKRKCGEPTRLKICKKINVDYWSIIKPTKNNNCKIIELQKPYKTPPDPQLVEMHKNLDSIFESGDIGLISAIEANLNQFKEIAELKKTVSTQSEQIKNQDGKMKLLEDRLKAMEVKSG